MQRSQIDFLNHGILPFVGREREMATILEFWRETAESSELRAMLLLGEAGIGKSRLIEESSRHISAGGGVAVHIKLYPDSATSLAPLLARSLARSGGAQQLLKGEPEETFASVSAALIRICGLRPTLLVVEDLHLLHGDGLRDFALLLESLADEPLSLLCAARPVTLAARSVLERYLTSEIDLAGLPSREIASLCQAVLGEKAGEELVEILREKTLGNALALRSALRAGLKSGAMTSTTGEPSAPSPLRDQRSFIDTLEQNVRLLSEGMAAHLSEPEKEAAEKLACLGEVFAAETAAAVLENAQGMLDTLSFKGVIASLVSPPSPVSAGRSASPPLAFTHTLLHRHFIDHAKVDPNPLVRAVAGGLPLYSILPFSLITAHHDEVTADAGTLRACMDETLETARRLDAGSDWAYALALWKGAWLLGERLKTMLEPEKENEIEMPLLSSKLALERRAPQSDYQEVVERMLERTTETTDESHARFRLLALLYQRRLIARSDLRRSLEVLGEVEELAARFPASRYTNAYVGHLRDSARIANRLDDRSLSQSVEKLTEKLLLSEGITDEWKKVIWLRLIPHFLSEFSTPEELEKRIGQLRELESTQGNAVEVVIWKINFLYTIGYMDETVRTAEQGIQLYRELGLMPEVSSCATLSIFARAMLGADLAALTAEMGALLENRPQPLRRQLQMMMAIHGSLMGIIIDRPEWRAKILEITQADMTAIPAVDDLMIALYAGDLRRADELLGRAGEEWAPAMGPWIATALGAGPPEDLRTALAAPRRTLESPILELKHILVKRIIMEILIAAQGGNIPARAAETIRTELHAPLDSIMTWFADRSLATGMTATMERYGAFFPKGELKSWRTRTAAIAHRESTADQTGRKTRVSLLGSIVIQPPAEEPVRVRGAQLCTLLGLMTADRMMARPLTQNEFVAIVMGSDRDPESARKSMNFAVFRLRELLGSDAISTTGETPSLNLDLVEVDLLDAHRNLRDATDALHDGALLRAYPKLIAALDITSGQVPFPTLYDDLFESAREDFEIALRSAVIRIAHALRREGDDAAAEQVLDRAFRAMPDDQEVAELLQEVLRTLGKRTEATRIAMKGNRGIGD